MDLDDFDRRLLDALQENNRRTGEELATMVGLSPAACLRRAQRLRESGVIEREIAVLAPELVNNKLTMLVLVTVDCERTDLVDAFKRSMARAPEVMQCYYVTGAVDFALLVSVADMPAYEAFTERYLFEKHVLKFESLAVMSRVKFGTKIPLANGSGGERD
jgi:Lrp/AsnC family leucine-responsive transcriptional regulator